MEIGISRIVLVGFAAVVMLCQDLALGLCHQSNTIFLETCPCSQEDDCCPSQCPEGCTTFLDLELDSYAKSENVNLSGKIELPMVPELRMTVVRGKTLIERQVLCFLDSPDPPGSPYGRSMLCRYCVARI